jgi:hypothetical protein
MMELVSGAGYWRLDDMRIAEFLCLINALASRYREMCRGMGASSEGRVVGALIVQQISVRAGVSDTTTVAQ